MNKNCGHGIPFTRPCRECDRIWETEVTDKLFLELSQITSAKTSKEIELESELTALRETAQNYQTDVLGYRKYALEIEALLAPEGSISLDGDERLGRILASIKAGVNALREKCEELQAKLNTAIDALDDANEGIARRQSQLDEAAKQKPEIYVAAIHIRAAQENGECKTVIYGDDEHVHHVDPLYRHPPNLPALIEQARAEELEANIKAIEESQPPETTPQACVAALRARSGK